MARLSYLIFFVQGEILAGNNELFFQRDPPLSTLNNYAAVKRVDNINEVLAQKHVASLIPGTDQVNVQKEVARTRELRFYECKAERLTSDFMEFTIDTPVSQLILDSIYLEFDLQLLKVDGSALKATDSIYLRNNFLTDLFKYIEVYLIMVKFLSI